jgi:tetratricopeptide (TPR) repeat protein
MALLQTLKPVNVPQTIHQALDCHRQGKLAQAEKLYAEVLAIRPDYFEALHMLGLIKLQRGDLVGALQLMSGALRIRPKSPELLLNYANVLNALGRDADALTALDQVLSVKRRSVEAHNNRGAVLERLCRDQEALEAFGRALDIKSTHADALYNRGSVLRKIGRHEEALKDFKRVLKIKSDYFKAHNNLGLALDALERPEEALANYDRALALAPGFIEAHNNRGNILQKLGRHDDAVKAYDRALAIKPDYAEVLNNRGRSLSLLGRHEEALANTTKAIAVRPSYIDAQWNQSLLQLRLGNFANGWRQYEWRWKRGEGLKKLRHFPQPLWLGESPIAGKMILVHFEQGLGDTIQFARYAALLAEQGARVILEVQPPLKPLLSQLGGDRIQVIGSGEDIPDFDLHCPLLSLPLAFRTELSTIPAKTPYLLAPSDKVTQWEARLPRRPGLRVGLVWSGNASHKDDHNRSVPLSRLTPLFDIPGVFFVGLQKEIRDADAQILAQHRRILDLAPQFNDFSDTAAAIAGVDLVISVDTSVVHLAGALGKPVWVLVPFCPDWRWLLNRNDSPWYSTARLYRQPGLRDWESVVGEVRRDLTSLAEQALKIN